MRGFNKTGFQNIIFQELNHLLHDSTIDIWRGNWQIAASSNLDSVVKFSFECLEIFTLSFYFSDPKATQR